MPEYIYRAVTEKGQIVRNRVEDVNRNTLIKKLKNNNLLPISITQVGYNSKRKKANKSAVLWNLYAVFVKFCIPLRKWFNLFALFSWNMDEC